MDEQNKTETACFRSNHHATVATSYWVGGQMELHREETDRKLESPDGDLG